MKQLWLACLLVPALTFAAQPTYEELLERYKAEFQDQEEQIVDSYNQEQAEENFAYDNEVSEPSPESGSYAFKRKQVQRKRAAQQQQLSEEYAPPSLENEPSERYTGQSENEPKRRQPERTGKRTVGKRNATLQKNRPLGTQPNSARPRVTHRNEQKKSVPQQRQMEADAAQEPVERQEEPTKVEPSKSRHTSAEFYTRKAPAQKKVSQQSRTQSEGKKRYRSNYKQRKQTQKSLHHPGHRPVSE